jgi:predicted metal-dependent phosphotriesterase family hydrolase
MSGFVRTVLGDVAARALGRRTAHEHVITRPAARFGDDLRLDDEGRAAATSRLGEDRRATDTCSRPSSHTLRAAGLEEQTAYSCSSTIRHDSSPGDD